MIAICYFVLKISINHCDTGQVWDCQLRQTVMFVDNCTLKVIVPKLQTYENLCRPTLPAQDFGSNLHKLNTDFGQGKDNDLSKDLRLVMFPGHTDFGHDQQQRRKRHGNVNLSFY